MKKLSPQQRFENNYTPVPESGCWIWLGALVCGYGNLMVNGKTIKAHRFSYEQKYGKIPEGMQLDHLCRVRCCVNPNHLETVTQKENINRGICASTEKTHCPKGHPYNETNTFRRRNRNSRECRICMRQNLIKSRQRQKNMSIAQACGG